MMEKARRENLVDLFAGFTPGDRLRVEPHEAPLIDLFSGMRAEEEKGVENGGLRRLSAV